MDVKFADLEKPLIGRDQNRVMEVFLRYAGLRPDPYFYRPPDSYRFFELYLPNRGNVHP